MSSRNISVLLLLLHHVLNRKKIHFLQVMNNCQTEAKCLKHFNDTPAVLVFSQIILCQTEHKHAQPLLVGRPLEAELKHSREVGGAFKLCLFKSFVLRINT